MWCSAGWSLLLLSRLHTLYSPFFNFPSLLVYCFSTLLPGGLVNSLMHPAFPIYSRLKSKNTKGEAVMLRAYAKKYFPDILSMLVNLLIFSYRVLSDILSLLYLISSRLVSYC